MVLYLLDYHRSPILPVKGGWGVSGCSLWVVNNLWSRSIHDVLLSLTRIFGRGSVSLWLLISWGYFYPGGYFYSSLHSYFYLLMLHFPCLVYLSRLSFLVCFVG